MAPRSFPGLERRDWPLGVQSAPLYVPPSSSFPRVCAQVPSSLRPQTEGHCFLLGGCPLLHYPRGYRPNDADNLPGFCNPIQPGSPHRALPEDDFPAKSSDFRAIFPSFLSNSDHQSPVSFFHIFHQRESDCFGCVCSTWIFF